MQVDLPAFERPTKAISGTSMRGRCLSSGAVVKNLAVCSQPMAILGSGRMSVTAGVGEMVGGGADVVMMCRWACVNTRVAGDAHNPL